jgi:sugar-specific transcriptional regulator TrmB
MNATTEFLERQAAALLELIEKKDAYITRLQDEVSQKSQTIYTVRAEQQNFRNSVKEYVVEALTERQMTHEVAETLANILDFELTKTVTVTATVDFEVELEVPFDMDADEVANTLEFSVDSFDYSIDDFSLDVSSLQASDNIS